MIRTIFAAALAFGAIVSSAQAMPLAPYGAQGDGDVIAVAGGCGQLAPRPLWRLPEKLRQPRRACLSARLPYRTRRRLPRQRQVTASRPIASQTGVMPGLARAFLLPPVA